MQTEMPVFVPRRGLGGGHRQTSASFFLTRRIALPPAEARLIEVEPGVQVLAHCHWQDDRQRALTVIIVHGLEGSSDSSYMQGIAAKGFAIGMNVVRMNQRNCGGTEALAPTLYHSGRSRTSPPWLKISLGRTAFPASLWPDSPWGAIWC